MRAPTHGVCLFKQRPLPWWWAHTSLFIQVRPLFCTCSGESQQNGDEEDLDETFPEIFEPGLTFAPETPTEAPLPEWTPSSPPLTPTEVPPSTVGFPPARPRYPEADKAIVPQEGAIGESNCKRKHFYDFRFPSLNSRPRTCM